MTPFQFMTPRSAESAVAAVKDDGRYFAGGVDLLGEMKEYIVSPKTLVNIKSLPGLDKIDSSDQRKWVFGANATVARLASDPEVRKTFPGLADAAAHVASPQIRNVATIGGNLAQHSRCWYYRHRDITCLKRGGSTCYAREGENRYHSLFSGNPCISPTVSTLAIIFSALDASVIVLRSGQEVTLSIAQLYEAAWLSPLAHNSLQAADLILRVEVSTQTRPHSAFVEISHKAAFDWALVTCAAAAELKDGFASNVRIALGSISPVPHTAESANALLEGQRITESLAERAAGELLRGATPFSGNGYKIPMAIAAAKRAILKLAA